MNKTLSELFAPPEGLFGQHAILCALSATESFLDHALEAFTGRSRQWRHNEPGPYFFLMLDRTSPRVSPVAVPGVVCLDAAAHPLWEKILVMHAKVALLGFGRSRSGAAIERLRLIVYTGNWTEESAKRQIELAWVCDVDLASTDDGSSSDIVAAAEFLVRLVSLYHRSPWQSKIERLLTAGMALYCKEGITPRFFHTLGTPDGKVLPKSMLSQFAARVPQGGRPFNFIVCGSGFFEQAKDNDNSQPELLLQLTTDLQNAGKLSRSIQRSNASLVINPNQCGQVANWLKGLGENESSWIVRKPNDAENRALHAKYVFLANRREDRLSNGFLYLGSGNLSLQGFVTAPSLVRSGNVEAGICIKAANIVSADDGAIAEFVPWGDEVQLHQRNALQPGIDENEIREPLAASPIAFLRKIDGCTFFIEWQESRPCGVMIAAQTFEPLVAGQTEVVLPMDMSGASYIKICDEFNRHQWHVPVLDAQGELTKQPFRVRNWDELVSAFNNFVLNQEDIITGGSDEGEDAEDNEKESGDRESGNAAWTSMHSVAREYAAHSALQLVELISDKNEILTKQIQRLPDWTDFLRRIFKETLPDNQKTAWQALQVNFLSVLVRPYFAPSFGPDDHELQSMWETTVSDLAMCLGVDCFPNIDEGVEL